MKPISLIIDTDLGCDCDDAGALAVAHALEGEGLCRITAMTHCTSRSDGYAAMDAINRYYGRGDIPIGTYREPGFLDSPEFGACSRAVADRFDHRFRSRALCPDAVRVLRRALAEASPGEVVLAAVGPMNNIAALLASPPDDIAPLTGRELVAINSCPLVAMAGCFEDAWREQLPSGVEWNVAQQVPSTRQVIDAWPGELILCPFEMGAPVLTGRSLHDLPEEHPIRVCYQSFGVSERPSWDLCTVHFAVTRDEKYWTLSPAGRIRVSQEGVTSFAPREGGRHFVAGLRNASLAREMLEGMITRVSVKN